MIDVAYDRDFVPDVIAYSRGAAYVSSFFWKVFSGKTAPDREQKHETGDHQQRMSFVCGSRRFLRQPEPQIVNAAING